MAAIQVNIRYPELLLKRIDAVANGNRSEWILEACRMRLDGVAKCQPKGEATEQVNAGSNPAAPLKSDMQVLRDVCAGKKSDIQPANGAAVFVEHEAQHLDVESLMQPVEIPICGKDWWEDGNHYECLMDEGHKEQKHGLRGMVRIIES